MDELVSLSSGNNLDVSLLEELDQSYFENDGDIDRGGDGDDTANDSNHADLRQTRLRRHRESMARLRQDRRERISIFENQERSLQEKLHKMLMWMDAHREAHAAQDCRCLAYSDLVRTAESLLLQKYALEEELLQHQRFVKLLTTEIQRLEEEDADISMQAADSPTNQGEPMTTDGFWVRFLDDEAPFYYRCESPETCTTAIDKGLERIAATRRRILEAEPVRSIDHCLGWKIERVIDEHTVDRDSAVLHFRLTRQVARIQTSLDELLDRTWAALLSKELSAHGPTVVVKHMQKISGDAFIQLCNLPVRENLHSLRYFDLVSRMRSIGDDSAAIVMMVLNKQPRQTELETIDHCANPTNSIAWLRCNTSSLQFSHVDDTTIEIEYVGVVECFDQGHAADLAIECCAVVLRWEHLVLQPRLLR